MRVARETGVASPCIGLCKLDDDEICRGCYRHIAEIKDWGLRPEAERRQILQRCVRRRQQGQQEDGI